ncbi:hypothetical protein [Citrobacter sp. MNAZ 1397]|uniref:hypothetical protein n=1 Tax=Citrobacter sp. MNAZ 1397 TaxID=2911205 RepID=UPI00202632A6|nr:hypothetical protein [Citrobacter sp. MNAZ 1397]MCL9671457.1 hypothetical protein [Citrobacter sp. MNAZ 1397]
MAAQTPYPGYAAKRPIGSLSPGGTVAPVSIAPPGTLPDGGADALSGLRGKAPDWFLLPWRHRSPGKHRATGDSPGWRRRRLIRATRQSARLVPSHLAAP